MSKKKAVNKKRKPTGPVPGVSALRRKIDKLDREILAKISKRAELAVQVSQKKQAAAEEVYSPTREHQVLAEVVKRNAGPLSDEAVQGLFRELISGCRSLEKTLRVAYLGPKHTYSHLASIYRFGQSVELVPVGNIAAVFDEVERGHADFGIVPIENSTDGRISDTLDCFSRSSARICGEVPLRIHHHLLANCRLVEVREVLSKPQALSQCRNWLAEHLPNAEVHEIASTTKAAILAGKKEGVAAVASRQAAVNYGLDILAESIEDDPENQTRFAVIGKESADRTGNDKTSLLFEVEHRPGALAEVLNLFKRNRLNMTWIESFPIPRMPGRYLFFIELLGHQSELRVRRAIASLEKKSIRLEVLGSYARMEPVG